MNDLSPPHAPIILHLGMMWVVTAEDELFESDVSATY